MCKFSVTIEVYLLRDLSNALNLKAYFKVIIFFAYPPGMYKPWPGAQFHSVFLSLKFYWNPGARGTSCVSVAVSVLQWQSWVVVTETIWPAVPETLVIWPLQKMFANLKIKMYPGSFQSRFKEPLESIRLGEIPMGGHLVKEAWGMCYKGPPL